MAKGKKTGGVTAYRPGDDGLLDRVAMLMGVTGGQVRRRKPTGRAAWARHVVAYLYDSRGRTYKNTGSILGRCESNILHSVRMVRDTIRHDARAFAEVEAIDAAERSHVGPLGDVAALVEIQRMASHLAGNCAVRQDAAKLADQAAAELTLIAHRVRAGREGTTRNCA